MNSVMLTVDLVLCLHSSEKGVDVDGKMACILKNLHFEYYNISLFRYDGGTDSEVLSLSNFPRKWQADYKRQEYAESDPILRHARSNNTPVVWWDEPLTPFTLPSRNSKFALAAKEHRLAKGVSAPVHDISANCWSLLSLATHRDDAAAAACVRDALLIVPFLACCLHDVVLRLSAKSASTAPASALTKRERECIRWCSEGKTSWEISKILGISERTVVFHLQNATRKLGVSNRTQAVVQAIPLLRFEAVQRLLAEQQIH